MDLINKTQIKDIYQLIKILEKTPSEVIQEVHHFTEKRATTALLMNNKEAEKYLSFLRECNLRMELSCDRMRKKIISRFHEMGYRENGKINMDRVNQSIEKYGYLHKPLKKYTYNELPKLVSQFNSIKDDYLKRMQ